MRRQQWNDYMPYQESYITELKTELDDALTAMAIADQITLSSHPAHKAHAEAELNAAAEGAELAIVRILTAKPQNASENAVRQQIWADYAELIINAMPGTQLHALQRCAVSDVCGQP